MTTLKETHLDLIARGQKVRNLPQHTEAHLLRLQLHVRELECTHCVELTSSLLFTQCLSVHLHLLLAYIQSAEGRS